MFGLRWKRASVMLIRPRQGGLIMHVATHDSLDQLEIRARRQRDAIVHTRLRAVILARRGWTAPQIADALGVGRRSVQDWVARYNKDGVDGLQDQRRGGNRRYLSDEQEQQVKAHLDQAAAAAGPGVRHGEQLRQWIDQQFGVIYSLNGIYTLLHRLGYSWLMPRPRHPQADPAAQEAFKKTSVARSTRSPRSIPGNASKCGSKTKHASGNKAR
jgi:transposase